MRAKRRSGIIGLSSALVVATLWTVPAGAAGPDWDGDATWQDFDGNGFADLAVGAPGDTVAGFSAAGSVTVLYATSSGLHAGNSQLWTQDTAGVRDAAEKNDGFGSSLATGDYNDDGFGDLAIGVPGEDGGGFTDRGGVEVIFGGPHGLRTSATAERDDQFLFFTPADACGPEAWHLGAAVSVVDIGPRSDKFEATPDGFADLVVGIPGFDEDCPSDGREGKVLYLWGTDDGLKPHASGFATGLDNCSGPKPVNSGCGTVLDHGDFNGDGFGDLVMGMPRVNGGAGAIGTSFNGGSPDAYTTPSGLGAFGASVAIGDTTGDGLSDLYVGAPRTMDSDKAQAGAIVAIEGQDISSESDWLVFGQSSFGGALGAPQDGDRFGQSLAVGNLGNGSGLDLAIGVPGEKVNGGDGAGRVVVLYGEGGDLQVASHESWHQDRSGILDSAEIGDAFGSTLLIRRLGSGPADLVVGIPVEDVGSIPNTGAVAVIYGGSSGLSATGDQFWHRNVAGVAGSSGSGDKFGSALP